MTIPIEEQLRLTLQEMADEVRPSRSPEGMERALVAGRRRHFALGLAAALVLVAAAGAAALWRARGDGVAQPAVRPPHLVRLSDETVRAPGRSLLAILTGAVAGAEGEPRTANLMSVAGGPARRLATSTVVSSSFVQQLSLDDGTRLVRQNSSGGDPRLEVVDLRTGAITVLGQRRGFCPTLSPDNQTVAVTGRSDGRLWLLDARTGRLLLRGRAVQHVCASLGWSPDGRLLVVPGEDRAVVVARGDRLVRRLPVGRQPVNAAMSWSPDARSLLVYERDSGTYFVTDVKSGSSSPITPPDGALRPLGWAGTRVVWLLGNPGETRLVTTSRSGGPARLWLRIDTGGRPVETVQWSRDLAGAPR